MKDNLTAYKQAEILGKSQLELVIQVYDGAIDAFKGARDAYADGDSDGGFRQLEKARRFVTHLYTTLDMENGGSIANQLSKLYAFIINQTNVIEGTKDLKQIDDNINILNNIRLGWQGLKEQQDEEKKSGQPAAPETNQQVVTTA